MAPAVVEALGESLENDSERQSREAENSSITISVAEMAIRTVLRLSAMQPVLHLRLQHNFRYPVSTQRSRKADRMHQTSIDSSFQK